MTSLPIIRIIDPPSNNTNSRTFWPTPLLYNLFFFQRNRTWSNCHACKTILCETRTEQVTSYYRPLQRKGSFLLCFRVWRFALWLSLSGCGGRYILMCILVLEGWRSAKLKFFEGFLVFLSSFSPVWWFISYYRTWHKEVGRSLILVFRVESLLLNSNHLSGSTLPLVWAKIKNK